MKKPEECGNIMEVREAIDQIDHEIIELLGKRFGYVKAVVKFKSKNKEDIIAKKRYDEVIGTRRKLAAEAGLNPDVIEAVYKIMMNHFIEEELKLVNSSK